MGHPASERIQEVYPQFEALAWSLASRIGLAGGGLDTELFALDERVRRVLDHLVAKPEALAAIDATGSVVNTFMPGIGSILALALGGLYHGYRQVRNRKVNEALIQGVETARAVLTTTPQGQAADAQFVKWLMDHQKEAGVFTTVSSLVEQLSDNPAAKMTAQEIAQRVQQAQQQRGASQAAVAAS